MKKLLAAILLLAPLTAWATDTVTPRLSLTEPDINSANWGTKLNNNFGIIDAGVGVLGKANTWTGTNTFGGPIIISSYTTVTSSVAFSTITAVSLTASSATINGGVLNNITGITVSTLTVLSSATFNGPMLATAATFTAPLTVKSSMTVTGNGEVDGVFKATGSVILGNGSGNSVTVNSSATVNGNFSVTGQINAPVTLTSSVTSNSTIYGVGNIVQVVLSSVTASSATTTTTFANMGLNASITPKSATSLILIHAMVSFSNSLLGADNKITIFRNGANICQSNGCTTQNEYVANNVMSASIVLWDNPATTSSTPYQMRMASNTGTITLNSDANVSTLILEELGQ